MADKTFYKRNAKFSVGGRYFLGDSQGWILHTDEDFITILNENLKAFKMANRVNIETGLIIEVTEPNVDWETLNTISTDEAKELVKQYLPLKQRLEQITSLVAAQKLLDIAHQTDRPNKTIKLIESKVAELTPEEDNFGMRPDDTEENRRD